MKINKKLKYTFISSLTLIASAVSVVACRRNKTDDKNYTDFLTSLNNNLKGPKNQNDFFQKYSSFSLLKDFEFPGGIEQKDITLSIPNYIDPENTYIFDSEHQIKLSDLEYGGIKIDDKDKTSISFTNNNVKIELDDAFFVSKFDISVGYEKAFTTTKKLNYNLTSFFKLENTKEVIDLNFKAFKNIDLSNAKPSVAGFNTSHIHLNLDDKDKTDSLLGLKNNYKVLGADPNSIVSIKDITWANFYESKNSYFNVDFDKADSLKFDKKGNAISFTYDSLLDNGNISGSDKTSHNFTSNFYFIADLKKLNKDKSFIFSIDKTNPLAVIFSKN